VARSWLSILSCAVTLAAAGCGGGGGRQAGMDAPPAADKAAAPFANVIFGGISLGTPVRVSTQATTISYARRCPLDDENAFVQINVGRVTGSVWLADLKVTETGADGVVDVIYHASLVEPPAEADALWKMRDARNIGMTAVVDGNALRVDVPKRVEFPWDAQILTRPLRLSAGKDYAVSFTIRSSVDDWPVTSYLMRMNPLRFYAASGRDNYVATSRLAVDEGVTTLMPSLVIPWERDLAQNRYEMLDQYLGEIFALSPGVKLILRFGVEPPEWWRKEHPGEMAKWENGQVSKYVSVASARWRRDVRGYIHAVVGHLERRWGKGIVAYSPMAQSTGEWYYPIWDNQGYGGMDFSEPYRAGYQEFVKKKHGDVAAVAAAWGVACPAFAEIGIPTEAERSVAELGQFRNPRTQRRLIDFAEYQQEAMSTALEDVCAAVKEASGGKHAMGFYGYSLELPGLKTGAADTGHFNLGRLLKSPHVDGIIGIVSYSSRGVKGTSSIMSPVDSIALHGKLPILEDDTRTHLSEASSGYERTATPAETDSVLLRNQLRALIHGMPSWKLDLYGAGWYNEPSIWRKLRTLERLFDEGASPPSIPHDVAVVVDERSFLALKPGIELTKPLVYDLRYAIDRMGTASATWWLLDDLAEGRMPPHKLTILLNAFYLDPEKADRIRAHFERNGGTALFLYAPGYLTEQGPSLENMRRLTGFSFESTSGLAAEVVPAVRGKEVEKGLAVDFPAVAFPASLAPRFRVLPEDGVYPLGVYRGSDKAAFAMKQEATHTSVFHAPPVVSAATLAALAADAGVHRYAPPGTVVVTNGAVLSVTPAKGGLLRLALPGTYDVADVYDADFRRAGVAELSLEMKDGETRFFKVERSAATRGSGSAK
jgi:hypothetical protein